MVEAQEAIANQSHIAVTIPFIGDYLPNGWEFADDDGDDLILFVDSSGFGSQFEPALTLRQFASRAADLVAEYHPRRVGFAVVEHGQFQCYVGVLVETEGDAA
jgi:hypothetical protein